MSNMPGVMLYREFMLLFSTISHEDTGAIIEAVSNHFLDDSDPNGLEPKQLRIYNAILERASVDVEKYEKKVERMNAAREQSQKSDQKSGQISDQKSDQKSGQISDQKSDLISEQEITCNHNHNYNYNHNNNYNNRDKTHSVDSVDRVCDSTELEFNALWDQYPKKQGKQHALKAYQKARKSGTTEAEVRAGLVAYCDYIRRNRIEDRYIKNGSTWFNQNSWTDDYENYGNREGTTNDLLETDEYRDFLGEMGALIRGGKS